MAGIQSLQNQNEFWSLPEQREREGSFAPVEVDELVLALNLFVSAATKSRSGNYSERVMDVPSAQRAAKLFYKLAGDGASAEGSMDGVRRRGTVTLESAFATLWCHYGLHNLQDSICARVLGFYLIMERTRGAALVDWMELCPTEPRSVMLHPAIVHALAVVPVDASGLISAPLLIATAEALGRPGLAN